VVNVLASIERFSNHLLHIWGRLLRGCRCTAGRERLGTQVMILPDTTRSLQRLLRLLWPQGTGGLSRVQCHASDVARSVTVGLALKRTAWPPLSLER
jgi:hypothetical protein